MLVKQVEVSQEMNINHLQGKLEKLQNQQQKSDSQESDMKASLSKIETTLAGLAATPACSHPKASSVTCDLNFVELGTDGRMELVRPQTAAQVDVVGADLKDLLATEYDECFKPRIAAQDDVAGADLKDLLATEYNEWHGLDEDLKVKDLINEESEVEKLHRQVVKQETDIIELKQFCSGLAIELHLRDYRDNHGGVRAPGSAENHRSLSPRADFAKEIETASEGISREAASGLPMHDKSCKEKRVRSSHHSRLISRPQVFVCSVILDVITYLHR